MPKARPAGHREKRWKPGQICLTSGQYRNIRTRKEVTVTKGEPFPPAPEFGDLYVLVDATRHEAK